MKQLVVLLLLPGWDASPLKGYLQRLLVDTVILSDRGGTVRKNFLVLRKTRDNVEANLASYHRLSKGKPDGLTTASPGHPRGWRSGENTRLPPMWPGFDSRTRHYMWVEFVVGSRPRSEGVSPRPPVFPPFSKTNISKFQFDVQSEGHRFVSLNTLECHPR